MKRIQKYIINNLSSLFLSIFLPLFIIASMVFLIKLALYTAIIKITVWEMLKLYIFVLPELLFYTLPISFFVAGALSLFKLSNDNEIVVLFSLGISPAFILKTFSKPALLLTTLLLFDFFILFPHAKVLSSNFIDYKKSEAKFNLSASEFGHTFGDWLLYIGKENENGTYGDIFLFNKKEQNKEILISSNNAKVINDGGILRLKLTDGEAYTYSQDSFSQTDFKTMVINNALTANLTKYRTALEFWTSKERRKAKKSMFIADTLISFFPVLSLFLIASIGIVHARHQKGRTYLYLFIGIIIYFTSALALQKLLSFYTIPIVMLVWTYVTYKIYQKTIAARF